MRIVFLDEGATACQEWDAIVAGAAQYDFYHLSGYHEIARTRGEGRPALFVCEESSRFIALPLLIRRVADVPGLESETFLDATSVYGYAGPISSEDDPPRELIFRFEQELQTTLRRMNVVSVFSRLHPLFAQETILSDLGTIKEAGTTVVIDLAASEEEQRSGYRRGHRYDIGRLRRSGWHGNSCSGKECADGPLQAFLSIYHETMDRIGADRYYYFDEDYVQALLDLSGAEVRLFWTEIDSQIGAIGIFTLCNGIVQYHLSGTSSRFIKDAPMKLLLDEVRMWANEKGARFFHLGGGVGGRQDSLYEFKAGFSKERRIFRLWNWIVDRDAYAYLVRKRQETTVIADAGGFFPAYRQ